MILRTYLKVTDLFSVAKFSVWLAIFTRLSHWATFLIQDPRSFSSNTYVKTMVGRDPVGAPPGFQSRFGFPGKDVRQANSRHEGPSVECCGNLENRRSWPSGVDEKNACLRMGRPGGYSCRDPDAGALC